MKRFENENKKLKKKGDALQKERDTTRAELAKKVKLEPLCRQLQNHNNDLRVRSPFFCQKIPPFGMAWRLW